MKFENLILQKRKELALKRSSMASRLLRLTIYACSFLICQFIQLEALADDFPGKGDRFAWSSALPFYNRGNKYLEHGRIEEAVQDFEEAIYRYEYDPDFYINYGVALRKRENFVGAEQAFQKALELRANDWQACSNLANAYLKQNRLKETITCFQKAMKMQPPPPAAEKEAMLKDIADITKILSMQKGPAKPGVPDSARPGLNSPGKIEVGTGITHGEAGNSNPRLGNNAKKKIAQTRASAMGGANTSEAAAKKTQIKGSDSETPTGFPVEKQDLKKSGWDYISN